MIRRGKRARNQLGEQFISHSREMRESPAWRCLPDKARRILDRLEIEHMRHGGAHNGRLTCTYTDFIRAGVRREAVPIALRQCLALGFLEVTRRGALTYSKMKIPSEYRLTYVLGTSTSAPPTNEWRRIRTEAEAQAIINTCKHVSSNSGTHVNGGLGTESGTQAMGTDSGTHVNGGLGTESGTHASVPNPVLLSISTDGRCSTKKRRAVS